MRPAPYLHSTRTASLPGCSKYASGLAPIPYWTTQFYLQIARKREPTSGLEPLTCSLRVSFSPIVRAVRAPLKMPANSSLALPSVSAARKRTLAVCARLLELHECLVPLPSPFGARVRRPHSVPPHRWAVLCDTSASKKTRCVFVPTRRRSSVRHQQAPLLSRLPP